MASHCIATYGHFILVHGGSEIPFGTVSQRALYSYDTRTGQWTHMDEKLEPEDSLPRGVYGHTMHVIDHYVYLIGGTSGSDFFNSVFRFDLRASKAKWEDVYRDADEVYDPHDPFEQGPEDGGENTPIGRYRHETVVIDEFILMFGGGTATGVFDIRNLYIFNTIQRKWSKRIVQKSIDEEGTPTDETPYSRKCHSVNVVGSYVYLFGGQGIARNLQEQASPGVANLNDIWRIKVSRECLEEGSTKELMWEYMGLMPYQVHFHSSALHMDSKAVYIFGGNITKVRGNRAALKRTNVLSAFGVMPPSLRHRARLVCHTENLSVGHDRSSSGQGRTIKKRNGNTFLAFEVSNCLHVLIGVIGSFISLIVLQKLTSKSD